MRFHLLACCVVAGFLPASAASADALTLNNGGQIKGTVEVVTFFADGKNVAYRGRALSAVWISETAHDLAVLADGTKVEGELLSVKIKSVGGSLTYKRNDIKLVKFVEDPRAVARRKFAAKKAALAAGDAKGLLELALWCRENKLHAKVDGLAEASLKADPKSSVADQAHELLGHVRYEGLWLTRAEWARQKKADGIDAKPDPPTDKEPASSGEAPAAADPKLTPEQLKEIQTAVAANEQLFKVYFGRAESQIKQELSEVRTTLGGPYTAAVAKAQRLSDTIGSKKKQLKELKKTTPSSGSVNTLTGISRAQNTGSLEAEIKKLKSQLGDAKRSISRQARRIRLARARLRSRAKALAGRVRLAADKIKKTLLSGKLLTYTEMTQVYNAALKLN